MPLLVVVIAPGEDDLLTLGELTALRDRAPVSFIDPGHPLRALLEGFGIATEALSGEADATDGSSALVVAPGSDLLEALATEGADIRVGQAPVPDPLTAVRGATIGRRAARSFGELAMVMARLRGPGGCPWDHEQTHASLQTHLLEEAHEVLEAIDEGLTGAELEEELGDLLLQVVFHAQMAADDGRFDIDGVARSIASKLVYRHPHVFSDVSVSGPGEVVSNWESLKAAEKPDRSGPFDGIPGGLPALLAAHKTLKRAAAVGHEPDAAAARDRAGEAVEAGDIGQALFWLVALARASGVEPETALRKATKAFQDSF